MGAPRLRAVSVVICTRDRPEQLHGCLEAVARLDYPSYEVVVVDNAPADDATRRVADQWAVRYVEEPVGGLSRARNTGARASTGEVVAFLDDDARPNVDWLQELTAPFITAGVVAVTGKTEPSAPGVVSRQSAAQSARPFTVFDKTNEQWFEQANFGGIGNGNNMAILRSVLKDWPGFDVRLGRGAIIEGGEEHHAFFQLIERGWKVAFTPKAVVQHQEPATPSEIAASHLRLVRTSAAYLTFLFAEYPMYRSRVIAFAKEALARQASLARNGSMQSGRRSTLRLLASAVAGLLVYLKSRLQDRKPPISESRAPSAKAAQSLENTPH